MLFSDFGIDLGTANTIIYGRGRGIVINEPSLIAINNYNGRLEAVGEEAGEMFGRAPEYITVSQPMGNGCITDVEMTGNLLNSFIRKCHTLTFLKPRVLVGMPTRATTEQRAMVKEAAYRAGAGKIFMAKESEAAAVGSGLDIHDPAPMMVVDIGAGITEISVFSELRVLYSRELTLAGNQMDEAIIEFLSKRHGLVIGKRTAAIVKEKAGSAYRLAIPLYTEVKGKNNSDGLPRKCTVSDTDVRTALNPCVSSLIDEIRMTLKDKPDELSDSIARRGIFLTGGGALLRHLDIRIRHDLGIPVFVDRTPLLSVARGAGSILGNSSLLSRFAQSY
jgi:rod shape-determining protein MreB and related proteins